MKRRASGELLAIDVVDVNVSASLRDSIATASKSPKANHLVLTADAIPLLQGIGVKNDLTKRECESLIKAIYDNGTVIMCPHGE